MTPFDDIDERLAGVPHERLERALRRRGYKSAADVFAQQRNAEAAVEANAAHADRREAAPDDQGFDPRGRLRRAYRDAPDGRDVTRRRRNKGGGNDG